MTAVYFSLGTNLGDRMHNMAAAVAGLGEFILISAESTYHETAPWGPKPDQPNYLNACVFGETELSVEMLLKRVKQLEQQIGRGVSEKWGPHVIDIDLIFYGNTLVTVGEKIFPPHSLQERQFVLAPLAEIAPTLRHPLTGKTVLDMLNAHS
jgi:2-amino-4-hydroxy-6-hydroxymethyldihydropteridine diphosphokinase